MTELKWFPVDLVGRVGIVNKFDRVDTVDRFFNGVRVDTVNRVDKFDS